MNEEERQRQMDFILQAQAQFAANMQKLEDSQTQMMGLHRASDARMTRMESSLTALLAIGEMHAKELDELREQGKATDERLNILIGVVERHFGNGKS